MPDATEGSLRIQSAPRTSSNDSSGETIDIVQVLMRQRWLIAFLSIAGLVGGIAYALTSQVWYTSAGKVLINERSAGLANNGTGTDMLDEDTLANHMELIQSRRLVGEALTKNGLAELESFQPFLTDETDAVDYVVDHLAIVRGGEGSAKEARTLQIELTHTNAEECEQILTAILTRYEQFIIDQVDQVMGRANELVNEAKTEVEEELTKAEAEYLAARQDAPLFFEGEGSSNVYQDRYRRLQEELLDLDIQESAVRTRLQGVEATLADMDESPNPIDHLDKLALIDTESLDRLGVFASLQANASDTAEFKAAMPAKMEEARMQMTTLLELNSERQRLTAVFGAGHPKVQELTNEIRLVQEFLQDNADLTSPATVATASMLTPEGLLKAYTGFLNHDLTALSEKRKELMFLIEDAESKARSLISYELKDLVLKKKIERQEELFDGIVTQLRELDTASGLSGYLYEFLEVPRLGQQSWPKLPLCGLGGLMLGMFGGLFFAVLNDVRDGRFRTSAELDEAIGLPNLGRIGKVNGIRDGINGLVAIENSRDAEAFRLARTILLAKVRSGELKSIGVTSPMQGDGKSTVISNLAVSFSQVGLKVLVIDADLRRPSVHHYFSVAREEGLCDVLEGRLSIDEVLKPTEANGVCVISAGSGTSRPAELLQSDALDSVFDDVSSRFDVVLVDMPPVLAVSDPIVVMPRLSGAVLVVRVANVRRDEVMNSLRRLRSSGGNLVGCMLNTLGAGKKFDVEGGYYGYYESDYTRSKKRTTNAAVLPNRVSVPSETTGITNGKVPHD